MTEATNCKATTRLSFFNCSVSERGLLRPRMLSNVPRNSRKENVRICDEIPEASAATILSFSSCTISSSAL